MTTGTLAELRRHTRTSIHAVTDRPPQLADVPGVASLEVATHDATKGGRTEVRLSVDAAVLGVVVGRLHAAGVDTLTVAPPSLDELFLHAYSDQPADQPADQSADTEADR